MTTGWLVLLFLLSPEVSQAAEPTGVKPGTLTGRITDTDGRPVAGVPLWAVTSSEQIEADLPSSTCSGLQEAEPRLTRFGR